MVYSGGQYRTMYCAILNNAVYQALSPEAKLLVHTLKLTLGLSGIDVVYPGTLSHLSGYGGDDLRRAEDELINAGWLRKDGVIYWLVNALEHESRVAKNNANHRKSILRHLRGLPSQSLAIAFAERYPDVIPEVPFPTTNASVDASAVEHASRARRDRGSSSQRAPIPKHVELAKAAEVHLNPEGWTERELRRECSIAEAMLKASIEAAQILEAVRGLAAKRDAGKLELADPGQPLSLRALYVKECRTNFFIEGLNYFHAGEVTS